MSIRGLFEIAWNDDLFRSVSPFLEVGAYEALWAEKGATFRRVAERFRTNLDALPSDLVERTKALDMAKWITEHMREAGIDHWGVRVHRAGEYPAKLRDAQHPVEVLYYTGNWDLVETPCVSIVGTRKPSPAGLARTRRLVSEFVADHWTIVSGLAAGVDTAAHNTAIELGGQTIAVLGTPICEVYPRVNHALQREIAQRFLLLSQVPAYRYHQQTWKANRTFFPERNITMSALTAGTVIVEASNTSGTRTQARAALAQGRKLFILESCFQNPELTWPHEFADRGAIRVREYSDIREHLAQSTSEGRRANSP
ncbi:MAG: DNA-processing protein DprA [Myxococcota bacterium]